MKSIGKYGIITAVSSNLWSDFKVFLHSLRLVCGHKLYVVNLGLSIDQIKFLESQDNIIILKFNEEYMPHLAANWRQWCKPFYFNLLPNDVDYVLWIDVDTVVLKPINELLKLITDRFFVVNDYFAPLTCINDVKLYYKYPTKASPSNRVLNSGVIGISLKRERDTKILKRWQELTKIVIEDNEINEYVRLYDQGVLIWALHDLDMLDVIIDNKDWNYPAKRNIYDLYEDTPQWPTPDCQKIGGDLLDNIKYDNPTAIIAHYAGLPKLSNLLCIDDAITINNYNRKYRNEKQHKIFIIGLERAGIRTLTEAIRKSCTIPSYVRYEYSLAMAEEAYLKFNKLPKRQTQLYHKTNVFNRKDCGLICETNPHMAFMMPEIYKYLNGDCKFILMLRDPVSLVRSRLKSFIFNPDNIDKFPEQYQYETFSLTKTKLNPFIRNRYRIRINDDLITEQIWELNATLEFIFSDAKKLLDESFIKIWLEDDKNETSKLLASKFYPYLDKRELYIHLHDKHGCNNVSKESADWIDELVDSNSKLIYNSIYRTLLRHNCCANHFF